jgi:hypothetical protein
MTRLKLYTQLRPPAPDTLQHAVRVSGFTRQYYLINTASTFQADFTDIVSTFHDIQEAE